MERELGPDANYRDTIQALGPQTLYYGGCEGRSFIYPTLLTVTSLMWINLFFYAPQSMSRVRLALIFDIFTLQQQDPAAFNETPTAHSNEFLTLLQSFYFKVLGVLITAFAIVPLQYAALLPNYDFPLHWSASAGVQSSMSEKCKWFQNNVARTTIGAVALMVYTSFLSVQFYSYLGNPVIIRDTWQLVKEIWLYFIHMIFCFLLLLYFIVLFVLPYSGKGQCVKVREWVLSKLERQEQLKLLLEGEFMDAIEVRKGRRVVQKDGSPYQGALQDTQVPYSSYSGEGIQSESQFHPKSKLLELLPSSSLQGEPSGSAFPDESLPGENSYLATSSQFPQISTRQRFRRALTASVVHTNPQLRREDIFSDSELSRKSMRLELQPSSNLEGAPRPNTIFDELQHEGNILSNSQLAPVSRLLKFQHSSSLPQRGCHGGSVDKVAENSDINQVYIGSHDKSPQPAISQEAAQQDFQSPAEVPIPLQPKASFRYSTWVTSTFIVTFHLLIFAFLTQVQFHVDTYNCLKGSSSDSQSFQDFPRKLSSCMPAQIASLSEKLWQITNKQRGKNVDQIRSALKSLQDSEIQKANVALGALDDMEAFYSDAYPSMEATSLNPLNPMHLFIGLLIWDKRTQIEEAILHCTDAYRAAFSISYSAGLVFGVYSILRVMSQYKQVSTARLSPQFQLRNRLMQALEERMGGGNKIVRGLKKEIGNILSFHGVVESSLFAAVQVSVAYLSLTVFGYLGTASLSPLLCKYFWRKVVQPHIPKLILFVTIIAIDVVMNALAARSTRSGQKEVANPGWWLFYFLFLMSVNMALGQVLAAFRIIQLVALSILDISRVDRSPLPFFKWLDKGYMSFYGVILLQEAFGRYFKTSSEDQNLLVQIDRDQRKQKWANRQFLCFWMKRPKSDDDLGNRV